MSSDKFYTPLEYGRYRESPLPRYYESRRNYSKKFEPDYTREKLYFLVSLYCLEGILLIVASQKVNSKVSEQGLLAMGIICLVFGLLALMSNKSDGLVAMLSVLNVIIFGLSLDSLVKSKSDDSKNWSKAMIGISVPGFVYFLGSIIYRYNKDDYDFW